MSRQRGVGGLGALGLVGKRADGRESLHRGGDSRSVGRRGERLWWCSRYLGTAGFEAVLEMQVKGLLSTFVCFYLEIHFPGVRVGVLEEHP